MGASSGAARRTTIGPAGGLREKHGHLAGLAPLARHAALDRHPLQPEALRGRRVAGHEGVEVLVRHVEDRPDVQDHAVAVEALARRPARLDAADGAQRLEEHALELGQLDHVPRGVAHRRQVAHLGHHEEPLVPRVALRHGAEEVDVVHRRQPLDVEVLQPVQLQALRHHGVRVAEEGLFRVASPGDGTEGEVLHAARPRDHDHDPPERARQDDSGQDPARLGGVRLGVARALRPPEEHVAHEVPARRGRGGEAPHAGERRGEARVGGVSQEGVAGATLALVARDREGVVLHALHPDLVQGPDPVEAPQQDLEDRLAHRTACRGVPLHEQTGEGLRALDEALDVGGARLRGQALGERREVSLGGGEGLPAHPLQERPLHEPEAHLARQVVDRRVAALRRGDQPVQERRQVRHGRERCGLALQEALEQQRDRSGELLLPLVRLADPVEALLELGRAGEVASRRSAAGPAAAWRGTRRGARLPSRPASGGR